MWTRAMIKDRAKSVLRFNYWKAFVVSLVLMFAGASRNGGGSNNSSNSNYSNYNGPINNEVVMVYGKVVLFIASIWIILILLRVLFLLSKQFFLRIV